MKKSKSKLPSGLFYRKRSAVIWCWYYVKGSNQPTKESTGTTDTDEAKRFRAARLAEHPTARTERLTRQKVTTADALALYEKDCTDHGVQRHEGRVQALRHALGSHPAYRADPRSPRRTLPDLAHGRRRLSGTEQEAAPAAGGHGGDM